MFGHASGKEVISALALTIINTYFVTTQTSNLMIYISAGHHFNPAGADPGAVANGYREADLTRELRDLITEELDRLGVKYITDKDSETLQQYLSRIKPGSGSVLCDLHFNAAGPSAQGVEVLVRNDADELSRSLAKKMCDMAVTTCGFKNRGVKTEADSHRGRLAVLNTASGISVLPEICFISSKEDLKKYHERKKELAKHYARLLKEYDEKI